MSLPSERGTTRLPALIEPQMADAAAMRHWLRPDVQYAVAAVLHHRLTKRDALHFFINTALDYAARGGMDFAFARKVAVSEFRDAIAEGEERHAIVLTIMVEAAFSVLRGGKSREPQATAAAKEVAREHAAPAHLIGAAIRIANWRLRQPPTEGITHG